METIFDFTYAFVVKEKFNAFFKNVFSDIRINNRLLRQQADLNAFEHARLRYVAQLELLKRGLMKTNGMGKYMFGYIAANLEALTREEKRRYAKFYCGLCHQLDTQYGSIGSATLTYDMTFLSMLLSALYEPDETSGSRHCIRHPVRQQPYVVTPATAYAAQMNILLTYYQCLDDWNDDHNPIAKKKSELLKKHLPEIKDTNPRKFTVIADCLQRLGEMEKTGELNPDLPANCFGELMGALFVWRQDEYSHTLWSMGASLGRFVYLLDAVNDLKADVKKQRYNPLVAQLDTDFTPMLTLMMAECTAEFEKLPILRDLHILQNHLYSGVWQKYRTRNKKGAGA